MIFMVAPENSRKSTRDNACWYRIQGIDFYALQVAAGMLPDSLDVTGNDDCSVWDVIARATMDENLTLMTLIFKGFFVMNMVVRRVYFQPFSLKTRQPYG